MELKKLESQHKKVVLKISEFLNSGEFYLAGGTANYFERNFPTQSYKIYLGALLSFEDYPELPEWVKETLEELV